MDHARDYMGGTAGQSVGMAMRRQTAEAGAEDGTHESFRKWHSGVVLQIVKAIGGEQERVNSRLQQIGLADSWRNGEISLVTGIYLDPGAARSEQHDLLTAVLRHAWSVEEWCACIIDAFDMVSPGDHAEGLAARALDSRALLWDEIQRIRADEDSWHSSTGACQAIVGDACRSRLGGASW